MRVFDRYAGKEIDLPSIIDPGRYRLLAATRLNGDIELQAGDLLLSDGRERCSLEGSPESVFRVAEGSEEGTTEADLVDRALTALALRLRAGVDQDISPLIPAELGELADLNDLEKTLDFVIERGHLDEIARCPRFGMHYEAEVAPLSRARRMAPNVESYLASHSEDWQRRTLSGVLPKRILALFSEDEWAIYENRVFARLLDRLDAHLRFRLREVEKLHEKYQDALNLSNAETLYYRLREELCKLWGRALSPADTKILLERSDSALRILRRLKRKVESLKQSDLYNKRIPRNARVPDQIRQTNILDHDQHYRHLARLWNLHQVQAVEIAKTPPEICARNQQLHSDYVAYLGMMLRRVLSDMGASLSGRNDVSGAFLFAGKRGQLVQDNDEWKLNYAESSLLIIPGLFPSADPGARSSARETRIPVYCYSSDWTVNAPRITTQEMRSRAIVVNPLEFYGLETLRVLIESFLWTPVFAEYGEPLPPLPKDACTWLQHAGVITTLTDRIAILKPLSGSTKHTLSEWLSKGSLNEKTRDILRGRIDALNALSICKRCGKLAKFEMRGLDFLATCRDCGVEWGVYSAGGRRQARFGVTGELSPTFESHGAWNLDIALGA